MRTIPTVLLACEETKQAGQMLRLHIVRHGIDGYQVQPPDGARAVVFDEYKRDPRRNWHAALKYAQAQPWAAPAPRPGDLRPVAAFSAASVYNETTVQEVA